jgi:hypothetical protein
LILRKIFIFVIILFLSLTLVYAVKECGRFQEAKDIPCIIPSSYNNSGNCNVNGSVFNSSGVIVQNLTWESYTPNCKAYFNQTTKGTYFYNGIEEGYITVEVIDDMVGLGVIIFLILLNAALFILPFIIKFTDDEVTNLICKRSVLLLGMAVLAFVTTIIITLADNQGLGITKELFTFQWIFLNSIYIGMILMFFSFFTSIPKLWAAKKKKERMGEE